MSTLLSIWVSLVVASQTCSQLDDARRGFLNRLNHRRHFLSENIVFLNNNNNCLSRSSPLPGLSKFFHNGTSLRKDAITASILKVQNILRWFEGQIQLTFYASSLLFVYEGLPPPNPEGHIPRGLPEKTTYAACCEPNEDVLEHNNNVCVAVPLDYSLSTMYTMHKKGCTRGHHGNVTATGGNATTDPNPQAHNSTWKCPGLVSSEQPNGNGVKAQLEEEEVGEGGRGEPQPEQRASEVEVRMIDFAHVFPSESQDQGYIYGLKHLLEVLQQILHQ